MGVLLLGRRYLPDLRVRSFLQPCHFSPVKLNQFDPLSARMPWPGVNVTGSAPQAPRLQGGVKERNELRFIPIREAPRLQGGELHKF